VRALAVLWACALALLAPAAVAQVKDEGAVAKFELAQEHYRRGRFADAVELLLELRRAHPEPVLLYNLGRAYEGMGQARRAIEAYEQYLAEEPNPPDRGAIERRVQTLRDQLAREAKAEREAKSRERLERERRERDAERERDIGVSIPIASALTVAGVLGVGAGVVLGVLAVDRRDEADAEADQVAAFNGLEEAKDLATAANVAFVVGGVIAAGGATWLIVELVRREDTNAELVLSPTSASARVVW